jgi:hypothetical protein
MTAPFRLTEEQLAQFERDGHVVVEELFSGEELQPVIEEITAEIDARARELIAAGKLSHSYAEEPFETRLARISEETDRLALSIWNGTLSGPAIFDLIRNAKLLDVAEQICGPELIASSVYRLRPKIPRYDYGAVPWHQDSGYTEPYCDQSLMLTVWLPLVDATVERGCLWVLPGVHRGEVFRHRAHPARRYLEIPDDALPPAEPIPVPIRKGGVLLLTNRTPHASFENTSDVVRWSMDLRYQNARLPTNAQITRLPEESLPAAEGGVPPACYPPEADFLVRSRRRPREVVTDPAIFHAIRTNHLAQPVTRRWG